MKRSLNVREKRLLTLCIVTLLLVGNGLALREFLARQKTAATALSTLKEQGNSNRIWMNDRALYEKRLVWLDKNMPYTASAGKAQGQLLDDLRNSALDVGLKVESENPLDAVALGFANEVSVSLRLRGDQDTMLRWLLTLQSPERFVAVKSMELELDTRSKEKLPQAVCNLTAAKWFNPNAPPAGVPAAAEEPVAAPAPEVENPLQLGSPLEGIVPTESSSS